MFKQSLIRVFKDLAEFHGYMPVSPAVKTTGDKKTMACQTKQAVVSAPKQSTATSCC